jgi:hypothetical protein
MFACPDGPRNGACPNPAAAAEVACLGAGASGLATDASGLATDASGLAPLYRASIAAWRQP